MDGRSSHRDEPLAEAERLREALDSRRVEFLRTELTLCFTFIRLADTEHKIGGREHAQGFIKDAEKGYSTLQRFLSDPKHNRHLTEDETRELSGEMHRLRGEIDRLKQAA